MATYASDGSFSNVQALHNSAVDGDIITIPAGSFTWATGVTFSKNIVLQGAGIGVTTISDNVQGNRLIQWTLAPNGLGRITGIDFVDGGRVSQASAPFGVIHIDGSNTDASQFRFDHNSWTHLNGFLVVDTVLGVADHNTITVGNVAGIWIYIYGTRWNGGVYGDGSWTAPINWGSNEFFFVEDNVCTDINPTFEGQLTDGFAGSRFVARHNTITNFTIGNHGTETSGRERSGRGHEVYNNTFDCNHVNRFFVSTRGGGLLVHDNTIVNAGGPTAPPSLNCYRSLGPFVPYGGADGTNQWDQNNAGNPFYTGTLTGVNLSIGAVTISTAGWTTDQWAGYMMKRTSGTSAFSYIASNTNDTLTLVGDLGGNYPAYIAGNVVEINKVDQALDQPGTGVSTLISGDTPVTAGPFTQAVEPCYSWNNTNEGSDFNNFEALSSSIQEGIHFFNNASAPGYTPYDYPHPLQSGTLLPPVDPPSSDAVVIAGAPVY